MGTYLRQIAEAQSDYNEALVKAKAMTKTEKTLRDWQAGDILMSLSTTFVSIIGIYLDVRGWRADGKIDGPSNSDRGKR
jgi:hypothetical protein